MQRNPTYSLFICIALLALASCSGPNASTVRIAAAADLKFALDSLLTSYAAPGVTIEPIYGSSGKLLEQIVNDAPFDLYLSADVQYPEILEEKGLTSSDIYPYAVGHLVLWSKNQDVSQGLETLKDQSVRKIAIANPRHAPYGKRAEEALHHYSLYEEVQGKLVFGENISQTAQFVSSGAADVGIIALSLALSPTMQRQNGSIFHIPAESHNPLIQGAVITRYGQDNRHAKGFFEYLKGDAAMGILAHFGFAKP